MTQRNDIDAATDQYPVGCTFVAIEDLAGHCRPAPDESARCARFDKLYVILEGQGTVNLGGMRIRLRDGQCLYAPAGSGMPVAGPGLCEMTGYVLLFRNELCAAEVGPTTAEGMLFSPGEIRVRSFAPVAEAAAGLYDRRNGKAVAEWLRLQIEFYGLLLYLKEAEPADAQREHTDEAVDRTIGYMMEHFRDPLTVAQLARMAGMERWAYSAAFVARTGRKPLDYLADLRIGSAKRLLLHSTDRVREIALQVGFSDEYYFNRRFKRWTGVTPMQYVRLHKRRTLIRDKKNRTVEVPLHPDRIVFTASNLGDLIALDVKPVGADLFFGRELVFGERVRDIVDVGSSGYSDNYDAISGLKPDLIITPSFADNRTLNSLSAIAPTVAVSPYEHPHLRIRFIARLLNKNREAAQWIDRQEARINDMWSKLQSRIRPGETAAVLVQDSHELYVISQRGLPTLLYHPFGFAPPAAVAELMRLGISSLAVKPEELSQYAGDRLFVMVYDDCESQRSLAELRRCPEWSRLDAVRNGQVYGVDWKFNYDDPLTHEQLIARLPELLARPDNRL